MQLVRRAVACLLLLLLAGSLSRATETENRGQTLQFYAPNTYAFARYGDFPVSHHTGIPDISLPLLSVADRDLTLPVTLSYYASGIKVDQEATWVGLGWSLNAGGMITRQVRGVPDERTGGRPRLRITPYSGTGDVCDYVDSEMDMVAWFEGVGHSTNVDAQPDVFYYNFCGKSGQFYLDDEWKGIPLKYEEWQIVFEDHGFTVTDAAGVVYEFGSTEMAYSEQWGNYISAWYLSSISSPAGGRIEFEYDALSCLTGTNVRRAHQTCYMELNPDALSHEIPPIYRQPLFSNAGHNRNLVVRRIRTSGGAWVDFTRSTTARKDGKSTDATALAGITAYNSLGQAYKRYSLTYGYFEPDDRHRLEMEGYEHLNYRLKLLSVQELAATGTGSLPPYRFSYYGDDGSYRLPYRLSPCQDHWGYYNGTANQSIFPGNAANAPFRKDPVFYALATMGQEGMRMESYLVTGGGDRSPHPEAIKAGTLRQITYPTGGSTTFEYEPHQVQTESPIGIGGLRIRRMTDTDAQGMSIVKTYAYENIGDWDMGKCGTTENLYHTWFYQSENDYLPGNRYVEYFAAFGVPPELTNRKNVLQINSYPQIRLGAEADFMYRYVTESIEGQGSTRYTYAYGYNVSGSQLNGVPTPGMYLSVYMRRLSGVEPYPCYLEVGQGYGTCAFPYPDLVNCPWLRGDLEKKEVYAEDGTLLETTSTTYSRRCRSAVPSYKAVKLGEWEYLYTCTYVAAGLSRPVSEIRTVYGDEGAVSYTRTYTYADDLRHPLLPRTIRESASTSGDTLTTRLYYAADYGTRFDSLVSKHILQPIDSRTYQGSRLVSGEQTQFDDQGRPVVHYRATTNQSFDADRPFTFEPYLWRTYNALGLTDSEELRDGRRFSYFWSYGGQYPIVRIEGLTEEEEASYALMPWLKVVSLVSEEPTEELMEQLTPLQEQFPEALFYFYKYKPSVGMTETIAPNGETTTYVYDAYNRLHQVKNHEGKTVEQYDYHYAGE